MREGGQTLEQQLQEIYLNVVDGQNQRVEEEVRSALDSGIDPGIILNKGLIAAMGEVGKRFEAGDFFVPEMLIAARAMQSGLAILKPYLQQADVRSAGTVVIGTVKGDLHDIGKNLVAMMLEGAGFEVIDLGTDVSSEIFIDAVREHEADLLAMSALLTTTMVKMGTTIEAIDAAGLHQKLRVMIGGAPVTESFALSINSDGYAPDASKAVSLAKTLLSSRS